MHASEGEAPYSILTADDQEFHLSD